MATARYDGLIMLGGREFPAVVEVQEADEEVKVPEGTVVHSCWGPRRCSRLSAVGFVVNADADELEGLLAEEAQV